MSEYLCTNSEVYDCAVIGLGGHGSATVAQLAQRGSKVIGIEKFYRCHDQGSSHGRSRVYRQAYFEHPMYVPLLQRSLELWLELEQFAKERASSTSSKPIKLINLCGGMIIIVFCIESLYLCDCLGLMMGQPGSAVIQGTLDSIKEHNLPHEYLTSDQLRSRYPSFHVKDSEVGVFEKNAGYLNPEACIDAYLQLAELHGATLYFNESMISWNRDPLRSTITVTTDKGSFLTNKLVLTVGGKLSA